MASRLVGRTVCPECGFGSAHVKQSDKCLYRYCPECQASYYCRNGRQTADLQAKTRPVDPVATGTPTATPAATAPTSPPPVVAPPSATGSTTPDDAPAPAATPAPAPTPTPVPRRRGFF